MLQTRGLAVATVLLGASLLAGCGGGESADSATRDRAQNVPDPLRRVTTYGPVLGASNAQTGTYQWLGIPYAKPPVGALRWMPPVEPQAWTGTRQAQNFGPSCAQTGGFFSPAPNDAPFGLSVRDGLGKGVGSEDCLSLNVWRPASDDGNLPVIVFIHGGSNVSGYGSDPIYNGAVLAAKARAVVVTINYRLGMFGWLDLGQLKTADPVVNSGNFATLDHIQALKYVQSNIATFGGNPGNVTVMGESAGSVNTWALLVSPLARGLFHKAVSMSGGVQTADAVSAKLYASRFLHALLAADGKAGNDIAAELYLLTQTKAQVANYLRSKTTQELLAAQKTVGSAPAVFADGTVLPWSPIGAILTGQYNRVPMLAGNTREEGKLFGGVVAAFKPNDYDRFTLQYNFDPDAPASLTEADLLNPLYVPSNQPVTGWNTVSSVLTTAVFTTATIESMSALSLQQPGQTWYYRFDWNQEPVPFNTVYGAAHALDLPFAFGNFGRSVFSFAFGNANKPGREQLSEAMMQTLGTFAATGNPQHAGLGTDWPSWPARLVFDASATQAQIRVER